MNSFRITYSDLWTPHPHKHGRRLPLPELTDPYEHIHGRLTIEVGGRALPSLGFFGPDDVCFGAWLNELRNMVGRLGSDARCAYVYDEGEQGQPAFEFRRYDDTVYISMIKSAISGAEGDPVWQDVPCAFEEVQSEVERFLGDFHRTLLVEAPAAGEAWWGAHVERGGL